VLKLRCDTLLSKFAFKFKLRRYIMESKLGEAPRNRVHVWKWVALLCAVGRCNFTLSNPS